MDHDCEEVHLDRDLKVDDEIDADFGRILVHMHMKIIFRMKVIMV